MIELSADLRHFVTRVFTDLPRRVAPVSPPPGLPMKGLGYTAGPTEDSESGFTPTPPSPICTDSPLVGTVFTLQRSEEPLDKQRASTKQTRENNRNHSPS